jgi:hypothetical protein
MERAEDSFHQSLTIAHRQGALSPELRTTSLARLLRDQGRPADLLALLQQVYDGFNGGSTRPTSKRQKPSRRPPIVGVVASTPYERIHARPSE